MMQSNLKTRRAVMLVALAACIVSVAAPVASAAHTCRWDVGPVAFECTGERGCAPGAGFTPQGAVFVGCAAWD